MIGRPSPTILKWEKYIIQDSVMVMKAFRVRGTFSMGEKKQKFEYEVASENEDSAREQAFSVFGSKHRVKRRNIDISDIQNIEGEEITDPAVQYKVGEKEEVRRG